MQFESGYNAEKGILFIRPNNAEKQRTACVFGIDVQPGMTLNKVLLVNAEGIGTPLTFRAIGPNRYVAYLP